MTTTLTGSIQIASDWDYQSTDDIGIVTRDKNTNNFSSAFTSGTGANQVNWTWRDRRTVTAGSPNDDIDLYGSLVDVFGQTINAVTIKELLIVNRSVTTGDNLDIGGAGSNPIVSMFSGSATAVVTVGAGGAISLSSPVSGFAVASGSADVLRIAYDGASGSITYDIFLKGTM